MYVDTTQRGIVVLEIALERYNKRMSENTLIDTMQLLGVEHDDAQDSVKMNRVNDIAKYFGQFEDGTDILRRVAIKTPKNERVDAAWQYMTMRKEHDSLLGETQKERESLFDKERRLNELRSQLTSIE